MPPGRASLEAHRPLPPAAADAGGPRRPASLSRETFAAAQAGRRSPPAIPPGRALHEAGRPPLPVAADTGGPRGPAA
eukprot:13245709-Heterocapsa_arctica.AAC.1